MNILHHLLLIGLLLNVAISSENLDSEPIKPQCDPQIRPAQINGQQIPTFNQFKEIYNKNYTEDQAITNCGNYYQNVKIMRAEAESATWKVSINPKFDLNPYQQELLQYSGQIQVSSPSNLPSRVGNPIRKDWRDDGIITSIQNQGSCGGCWSFATCAYSQSRLIQKGQYRLGEIDLSQQYLIDCTPQSSCNGGYLQTSFRQAADKGIPSESSVPYEESDSLFSFWTCIQFFTINVGYIPEMYYNLSDSQLISLLQDGPLAISISSRGWIPYSGGTFSCQRGSQVDHAVLLVGYDSDKWIVKNQWGEGWGDKGYIYVNRNPLYNCQIGRSAFRMYEQMVKYILLGILACSLILL